MKATLLKRIRKYFFVEINHYDPKELKLYKKDFTTSVYYITSTNDWIRLIFDNRYFLLDVFFRYRFLDSINEKHKIRNRRKSYLQFKRAQEIYKKLGLK